MERTFFVAGATLAGLAVLLGAFGAHWLDLRRPEVWTTAAHYHLAHAVALMILAWASIQWPGVWMRAAGLLFVAGIVLFSGSLYGLGLTGVRWLGAITPVGGICFLAGWIAAARGAMG